MLSKLRYSFLAALTCLAVASPIPGQTAVNTPFRVSSGAYTATQFTPLTTPACHLSLPEGSNGIAVLDAAVSSGCISSYVLTTFGNGHYVSCINSRCEATGFYWGMYVNGIITCYGIDDFRTGQGKELAFSYENWATAFGAVCL